MQGCKAKKDYSDTLDEDPEDVLAVLLSELSSLMQSRRLEEATSRVRNEKIRLRSNGLAHPALDLLDAYIHSSSTSSTGYMYSKLPEGESKVIRAQLLELLEAMLDMGLAVDFMPSDKTSTMTSAEEVRSRIGLGSNGSSSRSYDTSTADLYVRMAGIDWVEGMELLLRRGYKPDAKQVDAALVNAIRCRQLGSVRHLLECHDIQAQGWHDRRSELLSRLFRWKELPPEFVSHVFHAYTQEGSHQWIQESHGDLVARETALGWLAAKPGAWKSLHMGLVQEHEQNPQKSLSPGLWTTLFREYVQHGRFVSLLDEALSDGSFAHWKDQPPYKHGTSFCSWIVQGGSIAPVGDTLHRFEYGGQPLEVENPPGNRNFAQLRRSLRLQKRLIDLGVALRVGSTSEVSEAMDWAAVGRVPTRAFVHRHPEILLPSSSLDTPLHTAKSPEVGRAWEALGVVSLPNEKGVDPWVGSMQKSDTPASWGREIAARLKDGRIGVNASGNAKDLCFIAAKSPPLARLWLKKSKTSPPLAMLEGALAESQWTLVREWIEEGLLDRDPELRNVFFRQASAVPTQMTENEKKNWLEMIQAVLLRPDRPWPEQAEGWRLCVGTSRYPAYGKPESVNQSTLLLLADWGGDVSARSLWTPEDWGLLREMIMDRSEWNEILPITLSEDEGLRLFWDAMLDDSPGTTTYQRRQRAQKVWMAFDGALPIGKCGEEKFTRMRELDESQSGSWGSDDGFVAFLDAEEMSSKTSPSSPAPRRSPPGRRL